MGRSCAAAPDSTSPLSLGRSRPPAATAASRASSHRRTPGSSAAARSASKAASAAPIAAAGAASRAAKDSAAAPVGSGVGAPGIRGPAKGAQSQRRMRSGAPCQCCSVRMSISRASCPRAA